MILTCVRWYLASPLSDRQLGEMRQEHGVVVDHATTKRWVLKYAPLLEHILRTQKRPVSMSWWRDETYLRWEWSPFR